MTRLNQRQWVDVLNRAAEQAGREADAKYGLKEKAKPKLKAKNAKKRQPRRHAAAR
jgi:hypothetical protein